ncbi:serine/threonine protein phosphatase 2A 55 kDa regulatory subunit B beta isoform-like isoform X2 [Wolffia australiana]
MEKINVCRGGSSRTSPLMSPSPEWKFSQVFGERAPGEQILDVDIISAIEFDRRGDYLATGDFGGRIVLFERSDKKKLSPRKVLETLDGSHISPPTYVYKTEFQSHVPEFDCLKSLEIKEKINQVRWCASPNKSLFILSCNNRTIKLWKVLEQKAKKIERMVPNKLEISESTLLSEKSFATNTSGSFASVKLNLLASASSQEELGAISNIEDVTAARCRRIYSHAHEFNIHSISNNSDGETFISADDLRINLWNLEIRNQCFNIVDLKPPHMEDLVVITTAEFHPKSCNILAYGSSRGFIRLVDLRRSALCDFGARILKDRQDLGSRSFFTEIISSISDIKFASDGVHVLSRDFMNLKLWDLRMDTSPIVTYSIHENLRPKLHELYNSDTIFDKFQCCLSNDGLNFASGSYSNVFKVFNYKDGDEAGTTLEATRNPNRMPSSPSKPKVSRLLPSITKRHSRRESGSPSYNDINRGRSFDLNSKLVNLTWHPTANLIACASANSVYFYHA